VENGATYGGRWRRLKEEEGEESDQGEVAKEEGSRGF